MPKPRIIGGTAGGRSLDVPPSGTRPSPVRLREALFDILAFRPRGSFLDLYSGSGAIGLEAASRGWQSTCVDKSRQAVAVIERNARNLGLEAEAVRADALFFVGEHPAAFDIVFAAPPYTLELAPVFQGVLDSGAAAPGGLYIFQYPSHETPKLVRGNEQVELDARRYGSNVLGFIEALAGSAN